MKLIVLKMMILLVCGYASAQKPEITREISIPEKADVAARKTEIPALKPEDKKQENADPAINVKSSKVSESADPPQVEDTGKVKAEVYKTDSDVISDDDEEPEPPAKDKFHWKPALIQSGIFLGIQHGTRMMQQKTKRGLNGPFFLDWGKSVGNLKTWGDDGLFFTNYVAHPLQGGLTGRIFVNNSDMAKKQEFGRSKKYWESRVKALAWSAFWSTQFEIGPLSEASLGNVGKEPTLMYGKMGWNDIVVTPVLGTGVVIGEDVIEKYVLKNWLEKKLKSKTRIKIWRTFLTPTTSIANILRGKVPWKRDDRY